MKTLIVLLLLLILSACNETSTPADLSAVNAKIDSLSLRIDTLQVFLMERDNLLYRRDTSLMLYVRNSLSQMHMLYNADGELGSPVSDTQYIRVYDKNGEWSKLTLVKDGKK